MNEELEIILSLVEELTCYMQIHPAFRSRPIGAPYSNARMNQENEIALEDSAKAVIKRAETIIRKLEIRENKDAIKA